MKRSHTDARVTDPHGFAPFDAPIPRQRTDDPWDPAYVPDPRGATRHVDDPFADDPYTRHGGQAYAEYAAEPPARRRPARSGRERRSAPQRPPHNGTAVAPPVPGLDGTAPGPRIATVAVPVAIGSLVAIGLGVWAKTHDPTGVAVNLAGFSSAGVVKTWLGTLALVLALAQLWTGLVMRRGWQPAGRVRGSVGSGPTATTAAVHRWLGRLAVLVTVPVAVQCLIALGWSGATPRTLVHSLLGCVFYGAFVTKMLLLNRRGVPGWVIAVAGGVLLAVLTGIWLTSALWFFGTTGLSF